MLKSNSPCKSEKVVVFSGVDRTRRELVELIYVRDSGMYVSTVLR